MNLNATNKAKSLILIESKTWLSNKLGITRATLDARLKSMNWKKLEEEKLLKL